MSYATVAEVAAGFRELTEAEQEKCAALLKEADVLIDAVAFSADSRIKGVVECRMVRRAIGDNNSAEQYPIGATQGSVSALGYSQSWTISNGSSGELYLSRAEKSMLGVGNRIGVSDPWGDPSC